MNAVYGKDLGTFTASIGITQWINKDISRPDSVEFGFTFPVPTADLTDNSISYMYASIQKKDTPDW